MTAVFLSLGCSNNDPVNIPTPANIPTLVPTPSIPLVLAEIVTPTPIPVTPTLIPKLDKIDDSVELGYKSSSNMYRFYSRPNHPLKVATEGLSKAISNKDVSQVPIILEIARFFRNESFQESVSEALSLLTKTPPEGNSWSWEQWMQFLWSNYQTYQVPDGYKAWKSILLSGFDRRYRQFFPPDGNVKPSLNLTEIIWGGIAPDRTPFLTDPKVLNPENAEYLFGEDRVFGLSINGEHRAYPLRITSLHEVVNDVLGDIPIVVIHCVLCGSGNAYSSNILGVRSNFGTSGLIYRNSSLVYDLNNKTLWAPLTGEPIIGSLSDTNQTLEPLPLVLTTWNEWKQLHPETTVLSLSTDIFSNDSYISEFHPDSPLKKYLETDETVFPAWPISSQLPPKSMVLGVKANGISKTYPISILQEKTILNDSIGETNIVILTSAKTGASRVFNRGDLKMEPVLTNLGNRDPNNLVDQNGNVWKFSEEALFNKNLPTEKLLRKHSQISLWVSWYAFSPKTKVFIPK